MLKHAIADGIVHSGYAWAKDSPADRPCSALVPLVCVAIAFVVLVR